ASMHSEVADSNRSRSRLDDVVSIEIFLAQGTAIGDRDDQSIGVRAVVERMGIAQHELVRPVVIGMPQRVTCLQEGPVWTLVDLDALANTHGRGDPREHLGMHSGEGCAVGSLMSCRGEGGPGKTAPPPPQVMGPGRVSWYGNCGQIGRAHV